jgi:hypothetical protein
MSDVDLKAIDWRRMAEPQADQYDTRVTLALATTTASPLRPEPYVRRPVAGHPTIADGRVAIRYLEQTDLGPPRFPPAPPDHPNLPRAIDYLRRWAAGYEQFKALVDSLHPCVDADIPVELLDVVVGSCSLSYEPWFGTLCVTVHNALGCAQALVRELARQKLRALGVSAGVAWRLVIGDRRILALLHDQYALAYVVELDLRMLAAESDAVARDQILQLLLRNVVRLEAGSETLAQDIRTDPEGARFSEAFFAWTRRALEDGYDALDQNGYETRIAAD